MTVTAERCTYPWSWAMVTADGNVRPCCFGGVVGSLHEATFDEIWNGRRMLELRHAVSNGELHSICHGAACVYARTRATVAAKPGPAPARDLTGLRYGFRGVTTRSAKDGIVVTGQIVNLGQEPWWTRDDTGQAKLRIGCKLLGPSGDQLDEAPAAIPYDFLFPGEEAPFTVTLPAQAWTTLVVDLVNEHEYWFGDVGGEALRIVSPGGDGLQTHSGSGV